MRKIICLPETLLPKQLASDTKYFSIYSSTKRKGVGFFGLSVRRDIRRAGFCPRKMFGISIRSLGPLRPPTNLCQGLLLRMLGLER